MKLSRKIPEISSAAARKARRDTIVSDILALAPAILHVSRDVCQLDIFSGSQNPNRADTSYHSARCSSSLNRDLAQNWRETDSRREELDSGCNPSANPEVRMWQE